MRRRPGLPILLMATIVVLAFVHSVNFLYRTTTKTDVQMKPTLQRKVEPKTRASPVSKQTTTTLTTKEIPTTTKISTTRTQRLSGTPTLTSGAFVVQQPNAEQGSLQRMPWNQIHKEHQSTIGRAHWATLRSPNRRKLMINTNDPRTDRFISQNIHRSGQWDNDITTLIRYLIKSEECKPGGKCLFVDVGANIGFFSVIAADADLRVVSFEPMYSNSWRLLSTVERNSFSKQWTFFENAVSNVTGKFVAVRPTDSKINKSNGRIVPGLNERDHGSRYGIDYVSTVKLDDIFPKSTVITVMKMDVEGHEGLALRGAQRLLCHGIVKHIIAEWTDVKKNGYCDHIRVLKWMKALGYRIGGVGRRHRHLDMKAEGTCGRGRSGCPSNIWFELGDSTRSPNARLGLCPRF